MPQKTPINGNLKTANQLDSTVTGSVTRMRCFSGHPTEFFPQETRMVSVAVIFGGFAPPAQSLISTNVGSASSPWEESFTPAIRIMYPDDQRRRSQLSRASRNRLGRRPTCKHADIGVSCPKLRLYETAVSSFHESDVSFESVVTELFRNLRTGN